MNHEHTDDAICPYCGRAHQDIWELGDSYERDCNSCGRTFLVERHVSITYSTKRVPCVDDKHSYSDEIDRTDYDQTCIDRWLSEGGCLARIAKEQGTHTLYIRICQECGYKEYANVGLNAPCPWTSQEAS